MSLSFSYSGRATLIPIQRTCRSHSHTAVGLLSFPFVMSLSFSYSGRATLILHCRVALILIQRSGYSHFALSCRSHSHTAIGPRSFRIVVLLSFSYSDRATLIPIQRTCRSHSHTAVGLLSFCNVMWLSFPLISSQGLYFGTRLYRPYRLHELSRVQATGCDLICSHWSVPDGPHGLSRVQATGCDLVCCTGHFSLSTTTIHRFVISPSVPASLGTCFFLSFPIQS